MGVSGKFVFFILSLLLLALGLALIIYGGIDYKSEKDDYVDVDRVSVVIDAGGSGTRIIIYTYVNDTFKQIMYEKCERKGLTKYSENELPTLKNKLDTCFNNGAAKVPKGKRVPLYFAATAGMRLLKLRDPVTYNKIWDVIRERIDASEFKLSKADTITGFEEANWAWVAANYLSNTINSNSTIGIIEFGSSSVQVAFEPQKSVKKTTESIKTLDIDGRKKRLYGVSYLCYGAYEMERRISAKVVIDSNYSLTASNPCFFSGFSKNVTSDYLWAAPCCSGEYAKKLFGEELSGPTGKTFTIKGTGNFDQCSKIFADMITSKCTNGTCGINDEFQPKLHGKFYALGAFYNAAKTLRITGGTKNDFLSKALTLCGRPWSEAAQFESGDVSKYTYQRCTQSAYGYFLLNNGFKFNQNAWGVSFMDKINGNGVAWSLGLVYSKKDEMYTRTKLVSVIITKKGLIAAIVIGVICVLVGLFIAYKCTRRSKGADTSHNVMA